MRARLRAAPRGPDGPPRGRLLAGYRGWLAVLTVAKVTASGAAAYGQYLEGRTIAPEMGDYYLSAGERVEAPGRWASLGQRSGEALGVDVSQPVAAEEFRALMAVRNPATGGALRAGGAGGEAVAAIDATFSAPKSVSAVWALGSPELRAALESAQERAVDAALEHATEYVPMVRRRVDKATVLRECPAELLASSWRHTTARAVAGRPPDPQLHSHVVLHGAVRRGDGKVVAIESRAWLVHQRELGAAYRARLAAELGGLGFEVQAGTGRGGRYFELSGVPQGLLEEWSGRHHQVRAAIDARLAKRLGELRARVEAGGPGVGAAAARLAGLERSGQLMPAEQRAVAMATRAGKGQLLTAGDLDYAWWQAAQEYGFDTRSVETLRERGRPVELDGRALEQRILAALTEFDATFAPRQARAVALEAGVISGDPAGALAALDRLREGGEILDLADGRQTTRVHRRTEHAAVLAAGRLAATPGDAVAAGLIDGEVAALGAELGAQGAQLAAEQEQAVRVACSDRRLVVIVGQAGTGKSTALTGVARAHEAAGRELLVTSTGAQAAERLAAELSDAGVRTQGYSTAALQAAVARGAVTLSPNTTVVHDEAALASTREQAWLLGVAAMSGVRVIEVGDPRQSQAVGAGGLWPQIEQAASDHGGLVELSRIVRARDAADRRDQALWRAGEHERALTGYAARGRVVVEDTQQRAQDRALEAAHTDRQQGKTALVVTQTSNEQLDELNARAQALRIQDGELGEPAVPLAGRPYGLRAGDELMFRGASVHPELGAVRNGTRGTVLDVADDEQSATVRLSDGRQASWARAQLDAASARLAYVSHTFPAQGQTVDRCHVIAEPLADANGTYVALTRAREQTRLYASTERAGDREAQLVRLAEHLGRSEPEVPSISISLAHERGVEREHAEQSAPLRPGEREREQADQARAELDQARARLERARMEQREAAAVMDGEPRDQRAPLAHSNAQIAGELARLAAARSEQLEGERAELGRLARLGERGRALRAQLAVEQNRERDALAEQHRFSAEADAREVKLGEQLRAWEARHPGARERHHAAEREHQLAEQAHQAARQRHDIANARAVLAVHQPPPGVQQRLKELRQEQARLQALGQDADPTRLAEVRAELQRLTPSVPQPGFAQFDGLELRRRPGLGLRPPGPTLGR